jgi:twitching motility protein PilT
VLSQALCPRINSPGMVAAYEFMVVTPAIANLIRENKTFRIDSAIQTGKKFGMQLLDEHLFLLFKDGVISAEEAIDKCKSPGDMQEKVDSFRRGKAHLAEEEEEGERDELPPMKKQ